MGRGAALAVGLMVAGCTIETGGSSDFGGGQQTDGTTGGGSAGGSSDAASTDDDEPVDGASGDEGSAEHGDSPAYDVAPGLDPDDGSDEGCNKIDLLFVVDNSNSMGDDQNNLVANVPAFISGIEDAVLEGNDVHVGVVSTDELYVNLDDCHQLGALVTRTVFDTCGPYASAASYMTAADDLDAAFGCAARLGPSGNNSERPIEAMLEVLQGNYTEPGGCNEGFLRSDSLLVVVLITDEEDGEGDPELVYSPGTPPQWFDAVVAARGVEHNVVVLGLLSYNDGPCPPAKPEFSGDNLVAFTELFTHGYAAGICEDYGPYFEQALTITAEACEGYVPVG